MEIGCFKCARFFFIIIMKSKMLKMKNFKYCPLFLQCGLLASSIDLLKTGGFPKTEYSLRDRCTKKGFVIPTIVIKPDEEMCNASDELEHQESSYSKASYLSPKAPQEDLYHFENDCMPITIGFFLFVSSVFLHPEVQKIIWKDRE